MPQNRLSNETSPYLLQHAHNPVDWYPWGSEALEIAKKEDKPILLSIGYSACHWCHVMERECFENEQIAELMNAYFVCIKVDREERPDIDQLYMDAVHAMGLQGGWPLNVILSADAKPFYGGTYFPPGRWMNLLRGIHEAYTKDRDKLEESAEGFAESLKRSEYEKYGLGKEKPAFEDKHYEQMFEHLAKSFDREKGGTQKSPKFPMPCVWLFLLRYHAHTGNSLAFEQVHLTLEKMALGGIYDQIGGGFSRYSTDVEWFAPHFEKMLYDNGQLLSLYAEAYQSTQNELYKDTVYQTIDFVTRELTSSEGGFYSALDADSEGVEGKFYVWTHEELLSFDLPKFDLFATYFNVKEHGTWEHETNILCHDFRADAFCKMRGIELESFKKLKKEWVEILIQKRSARVRPGLDDKILASWNGLMLNGIVDAYRVFQEDRFLVLAIQNADFIQKKLINNEQLFHSYKNGVPKIEAFLEDYASLIQAFINLYQATFDEKWLLMAQSLTETCLAKFWDKEEMLFHFTSVESEKLIARKKEIFDNVIPSSNSIMAGNLILLGHLLSHEQYIEKGAEMLKTIQPLMTGEPYYMANWALVSFYLNKPFRELAISGANALAFRKELDLKHIPNKVLVGTTKHSQLELLANRTAKGGDTLIYVCENKTCQLPVKTPQEALPLL
jgi:uncharacterized protein YyaL (SSP411 family)